MNVIGYAVYQLTLEAPITAAADEIHKCFFFTVFSEGWDLMFQVNPEAEDSQEESGFIFFEG